MLVLILKLKVYLIANEQITEPDISGENSFEIYSDIGSFLELEVNVLTVTFKEFFLA